MDEVTREMTDEELETSVRTADLTIEIWSYNASANACARLVLEAYEKYPNLKDVAMESRYLEFANGKADFDNFFPIDMTLYDVIKRLYPEDSQEYKNILSGLSDFQWGWAINAARHILNYGPVVNPALWVVSNG